MKKLLMLTILLTSCSMINKNEIDIYENRKPKSKKEHVQTKIEEKKEEENKTFLYDIPKIEYIRVKDNSSNKIMVLDIETYLYSVVTHEVGSSFPMQALMAQAIAARTYAYNNILKNSKNNFDVYSSTTSQVYKKITIVNDKIRKAVDDTKGMIMIHDGKPINAMYHASSGSRTLSAHQVFGSDIPYLISVQEFSDYKLWSYKIKISELSNKLGYNIKDIKVENENTDEIIVKNVIINDKYKISANKFRSKVGNTKIKSVNFVMTVNDDTVSFEGIGYGHGVGMSQHGAKNLALHYGYTYDMILKHYYTNIEIIKIY